MKKLLLSVFLVLALGCLTPLFAGVCPAAGAAADCNVLITYNASGSVTITYPDPHPYDGSDDMLIGVLNNSPVSISGLTFSGSGNGGGAFMFDGDGACSYGPTCNHPPIGSYVSIYGDNGYYDQGSGVWFGNVNAAEDTGVIYFAGGIAPGATAWFSLESAAGSGPITVSPESGTMLMFGTGLLGVVGLIRRKINL